MQLSKKKLGLIIAVCLISTLTVGFMWGYQTGLNIEGIGGLSFSAHSIHMTISFYKNGQLIYSQYHAGKVTYEGMNMTLSKWTGNTTVYSYANTYMLSNVSCLALGYNTTAAQINQSMNYLPNEWVRVTAYPITTATPYNMCNWTCTIVPSGVPAGGFSANNLGICYTSTGNATSLVAYDTFDLVTGIDATFTITADFSLSLS